MSTDLSYAPDTGLLFHQRGGVDYIKAHGTCNDFIVINDPQAAIDLTPTFIQDLCHRQSGVGADGVIRIVQAGVLLDKGILRELPADISADMWFMDYYNHDGSIAEICGNGARVFTHIIFVLGYQSESSFIIGTRAGARQVSLLSLPTLTQAEVEVGMGTVRDDGAVLCTISAYNQEYTLSGVKLNTGNPHLVCIIPEDIPFDLDEWELSSAQFSSDDFPAGANVEIIYPLTSTPDFSAKMRVLERGAGETAACGSGAVAAAYSLLAHHAQAEILGRSVNMILPGGVLRIRFDQEQAYLAGASTIVSEGKYIP